MHKAVAAARGIHQSTRGSSASIPTPQYDTFRNTPARRRFTAEVAASSNASSACQTSQYGDPPSAKAEITAAVEFRRPAHQDNPDRCASSILASAKRPLHIVRT